MAEYIKQFLRLKVECSGFPDSCETEADKSLYIREYFKHEGIQLRRERIRKAPARAIGKICLNALWQVLFCLML